ncbi:MAG: yfgB [Gammaproteobacteria bacterium]|nr:yfgB [Gammaproteobacteria bacterium]
MADKSTPLNLLDCDKEKLRAYFVEQGEKPFRGDQVLQWLHQYGCNDVMSMSNISQSLRSRLADTTTIHAPETAFKQVSKDGTCKWLFRLDCGNCIETVFIPEENRGTLCISSQVGCGFNCTFCATGKQGFNRNLTVAEIIGQVFAAVRELKSPENPRPVTNIVLMGMGEPLLNTDNVISALRIMLDDLAYGLSKRRVTVSTTGLIPQMRRLRQEVDVALAVSLHAPNDALRDVLVPINRKYPLAELMQACRDFYPPGSRQVVTFEYVMLQDVNDSLSQAKQLARLLRDVPSKINLIPFNPYPGTTYQCSTRERLADFQQCLMAAGLVATIRKTRGDDIAAACGQLVGDFADKTPRRRLAARIVSAVSEVQAA